MSEREQLRRELVDFLNTVVKPGCSADGVDDATNLIDVGIIDSLAIIQIIAHLEERHDLRLDAEGVDPNDLGSIGGILTAIARTGE